MAVKRLIISAIFIRGHINHACAVGQILRLSILWLRVLGFNFSKRGVVNE